MANSMHVKKGDTVKVLSGKDKGKQGKVLRSVPAKQRVVVEKVNMIKKAMRPTQQNPQGGPKCSTPTRVSHKRDENGRKVRVCKKCNRDID